MDGVANALTCKLVETNEKQITTTSGSAGGSACDAPALGGCFGGMSTKQYSAFRQDTREVFYSAPIAILSDFHPCLLCFDALLRHFSGENFDEKNASIVRIFGTHE